MKTILLLTFSLLLPLSAQETAAKTSPVEQLLEVMQFEKSIIDGGEAGFVSVERNLAAQNLNAEEMATIKKAFMDYMAKVAGDPELKANTIEAYSEAFTEAEIQDLIKFYRTPVGQKTLKTMPKITAGVMTLSRQLAQKHVAAFQQTVTGILQRKAAEKQGDGQ